MSLLLLHSLWIPLNSFIHSPAALLPTQLSLMFLSCSSCSSGLLSLFSSLHSISWRYQPGSPSFTTSVSSSSQSACLLASAGGETAAVTLWESHWAGGLMWCLVLSVSSIILYHFQDAAVVFLSSVAHPCRCVLILRYCKMFLFYFDTSPLLLLFGSIFPPFIQAVKIVNFNKGWFACEPLIQTYKYLSCYSCVDSLFHKVICLANCK